MICRDIEQRLPSYLEGDLPADDKKIVADHLASCPGCSRALEGLKKTQEILRNLDEVEPPPFFEQRIVARIREDAAPKGFLRRFLFPLRIRIPIQVAATVAVAFIAYHIYRQSAPEITQLPPSAGNAEKQEKSISEPEKAMSIPGPSVARIPENKKKTMNTDRSEHGSYAPPPAAHGSKKETAVEKPAGTREETETPPTPSAVDGTRKKSIAERSGPVIASHDEADRRETAAMANKAVPSTRYDKANKADQSAAGGERRKMMFAPSPQQEVAKLEKQAVLNLTVRVENIDASVRQARIHLGRIKARILRQEHRDDGEILWAEVPARQLTALAERLQAMGRLDRTPDAPETEDGTVLTAIKIVGNP
jgi:hypothetical protein